MTSTANTKRHSPDSLLRRLATEPTVHFLLIAALLFGSYALTEGDRGKVLEIQQREINARVFMQELASGEAMSDEARTALTRAYIEEQLLVQEAIAMGLDNDARIHDLLAQKMRHVLSGNVIQPSQEELASYYAQNQVRYQRAAAVSVDELVFDNRDSLPENVMAALRDGADINALLALQAGSAAPLSNVTLLDLRNIFSTQFAEQVMAAADQQWVGPFTSNRGQHWLRITERQAATTPALEAISDRVRLDWIASEEEARLQQAVNTLFDEYTVIINSDGEASTQ